MSGVANIRDQRKGLRIFLSHNSLDKPIVESIAQSITEADFDFWLDKWNLVPGTPWQPAIEDALNTCDACIVFVGPSGMGAWQHEEMRLAIARQVTQRGCRVVPVLLPGAERGERSQLPAFLVANTWVEFRRSVDDREQLRRLICAIRGVPPGRSSELPSPVEKCPFLGLHHFDIGDSENFYGRDSETQWLLNSLRPKGINGIANRFLAIVGASGSGKSSLARAGLFSEIADGQLLGSKEWTQVVFKPGAHPVEQLGFAAGGIFGWGADATRLEKFTKDCISSPRTLHQSIGLALASKPDTARLALLVDQFEELYTQCQDDTLRRCFIDNLLYAASVPDGRTIVVITLRADFVGKCSGHADLASMISAHQELVGPLTDQGLREAIEWPARRAGRVVSSELVETLKSAVRSAPASLPLLQHVLLVLWGHPEGMTLGAYAKIGGLDGALARHADQIIDGLQVPLNIVRRIFRRLTAPGEGTEDTRRRALRSELIAISDVENEVDRVLERLSRHDARLLVLDSETTAGDTTVEVAHEALIRSWPKLRSWIDKDREGLHTHRRITADAAEWKKSRDPSLLYRGGRLAQASDWRLRNETELNDTERDFLDTSFREAKREYDREIDLLRQVADEQRSRAESEALRAEALTKARRNQTVAFIITILMVIGAGFLLRTANLKQMAERETRLAHARELSARATNTLSQNLPLALLLGVRAYHIADTVEARTALAEAFAFQPQLRRFLWGHEGVVRNLAFSSRGILASAGWDQNVVIWNIAKGERQKVLSGFDSPVNCVAFPASGSILAVGTTNGFVSILDAENYRRELSPFKAHNEVTSMSFSSDGTKLVTSGFDGGIALWDTQSGKIVTWFQRPGQDRDKHTYSPVNSVSLASNGKILASGSDDGQVLLWDVASGKRLKQLNSAFGGGPDQVRSVKFDREGNKLVAGRGRYIIVWDTSTGDTLYSQDGRQRISSVAFSDNGKYIASAGDDASVMVWNVNAKDLVLQFTGRGHAATVNSVEFSNDGKILASAGEDQDGKVVLWDVGISAQHAILPTSGMRVVHGVAFHPNGQIVGAAGVSANSTVGVVALWDTVSGELSRIEPRQGEVSSVAFSPDGNQLMSGGSNGEVVVSEVSSGREISRLVGHTNVVSSLAFSRDGRFLASASFDESVLLHTGSSWQSKRRLEGGPLSEVSSVSFGGGLNGTMLAAGYFSGDVVLWDTSISEKPLGKLSGHKSEVLSVAFSPDGTTLLSGSRDGSAILWDPIQSKNLLELRGNRGEVFSVAWSQTGKLVATGNADGTVILWATDTGKRLSELSGHTKPVYGLAFNNGGRTLASGGEDGRVILHDVQIQKWDSFACEKAGRNLKKEEWIEFGPEDKYGEVCGKGGAPSGAT